MRKIWIFSGLLALAIASFGWTLASAGPTQTGNDSSGGIFSARLGL
jgi:hypothetical protein